MTAWTEVLKANPIPELLESGDIGLINRIQRDLLDGDVEYMDEPVIDDPNYKNYIRRQKPDGSWRETGRKKNEPNWTFITTLRTLYCLLDLGANGDEEIFDKGARYIIGTQTPDGDFRGAYGEDIPSPKYTGMTAEVFFRGGKKYHEYAYLALDWLHNIRRNDGGWAIPILRSKSRKDPSSHVVTGMALRGFVANPKKKYAKESKKVGEILASRIFQPDKYPDRRGPEYWGKLSYPFWFTDALSVLDVLGRHGFDLSTGKMQRAFDWILKQQDEKGYWHSDFRRNKMEPDPWLTYAALRTIKFLVE